MFKAKMARLGLGRDLGLVASAEGDLKKKKHTTTLITKISQDSVLEILD